MSGKAIELFGEMLLVCTDSGCRPARAEDLAEVIELLPEYLERQDRAGRAHEWRLMAERQMKPKRRAQR